MENLKEIILEVLHKNKWHDFIDEKDFETIATETVDRITTECKVKKLNILAVSNHVSADLYEWSDTNIEGDITKNDCKKLVDWFSRNCWLC